MSKYIKYNSKSFTGWVKVNTTDYLKRPQGYYFYDEQKTWCYGPFQTARDAENGFDRWIGMPEGLRYNA